MLTRPVLLRGLFVVRLDGQCSVCSSSILKSPGVSRASTKESKQQAFRGHSFGGGGGAMPCRGLFTDSYFIIYHPDMKMNADVNLMIR